MYNYILSTDQLATANYNAIALLLARTTNVSSYKRIVRTVLAHNTTIGYAAARMLLSQYAQVQRSSKLRMR